MSAGLFALLDDIAAIAKVAAASLDDTAAKAVTVSKQAAGIVIDDTAVTPRYVVGFAAKRELPIIGRIAWGSLKNKLFYLLPMALVLTAVAPWAITPLLMAGGAFLCFEGYEKLHHLLHPAHGEAEEPRQTPEASLPPLHRRTQRLPKTPRSPAPSGPTSSSPPKSWRSAWGPSPPQAFGRRPSSWRWSLCLLR